MNKHLTVFWLFVLLQLLFAGAYAQESDAAAIRKQMSDIRKSTNWEDPEAARMANEKIKALSKQLMSLSNSQNSEGSNAAASSQQQMSEEDQQKAVDQKMQMWEQIMKIASEGGSWDLAEPLRLEIVEEYKEDENPSIKNSEWLQSISYLLVNLSFPHVQVIIDQMPMYRGVKTLIITTDKPVAIINLSQILKNAKDYPLEELYIINFGPALSSLPQEISNFPMLKLLAVYNNGLSGLPAWTANLSNLSSLQIQNNPIISILPAVISLNNLQELGIALTKISADEISQIQKALPECNIIAQ